MLDFYLNVFKIYNLIHLIQKMLKTFIRLILH